MKINNEILEEVVLEVAREKFRDSEFERRALIKAVVQKLREMDLWTSEDDSSAKSGNISRGEARIDWRITDLGEKNLLLNPSHGVWRVSSPPAVPVITRFYVDNFKGLRNFTVHFSEPLTVIAGRNGSGKTSVCQALDLLFRLVNERPAEVMAEFDATLIKNKWVSSTKIIMEVDVCVPWPGGTTATLTWHIAIGKKKGWGIAAESVTRKGITCLPVPGQLVGTSEVLVRKWRKIKVFNATAKVWEQENKELPSYVSTVSDETKQKYPELYALKQNLVFRYVPFLNPVFLRQRTREPDLGSQGENFASYLFRFAQGNKFQFEKITERLRKFFPTLKSLRPTRSRFGWTEIQVAHKFSPNKDDVVFKADQVNDGLLRLAAIATLPYADKGLRILAVEEPENGMHPRLLEATAELLRSFREQSIQVIITTHSPILLNFVHPKEAVIIRSRGEKGPEAKLFSDLKSGMKRLEYFDIGDVVYDVGEDQLVKQDDASRS